MPVAALIRVPLGDGGVGGLVKLTDLAVLAGYLTALEKAGLGVCIVDGVPNGGKARGGSVTGIGIDDSVAGNGCHKGAIGAEPVMAVLIVHPSGSEHVAVRRGKVVG